MSNLETKIKEARIAHKKTLKRKTITQTHGKLLVVSLILLGIIIGSAYTFIALNYQILLESKTVVIHSTTPVAEAQEETKEVDNVEELANMIYKLESSSGKNIFSKCREIGKTNGIGYGIYDDKWQCFDNHEDEMAVLKGWIIDKKAKNMTDNELLCLYSGNHYQICNN